ncbi:hypothetical protein [Paraglaciecola sp.]|uniref:hypothetical protein n=1 Tax=Paraglaciecola sp. TaxID=1920173 RepID=UPI0032656966
MLFIKIICGLILLGVSFIVRGFDAGEHALIGDLAFESASLGFSNEIRNLEVDTSFSYGQLVAMSGDMYKNVEEIALGDVGVLNSFFKRNRKSLKTCINKEITVIKEEREYSGRDDLDFAKKKLRCVSLAHDNFSHFAWHYIKAYIHFHNQALWFAQLAYLKCDESSWENVKTGCETKPTLAETHIDGAPYRERLKSKYHQFPKLFPRTKLTERYLRRLTKEDIIHLALFANAFTDSKDYA